MKQNQNFYVRVIFEIVPHSNNRTWRLRSFENREGRCFSFLSRDGIKSGMSKRIAFTTVSNNHLFHGPLDKTYLLSHSIEQANHLQLPRDRFIFYETARNEIVSKRSIFIIVRIFSFFKSSSLLNSLRLFFFSPFLRVEKLVKE